MWALEGKERCFPQPPARLGSGAASTAWLLPFYLLDQKLAYHFQRNRPQEYFSLASPALAGAGAEDSGYSCHISVTHLYCVLARSCILSPLSNKISAELSGPAHPTPCNTQTQPSLSPGL